MLFGSLLCFRIYQFVHSLCYEKKYFFLNLRKFKIKMNIINLKNLNKGQLQACLYADGIVIFHVKIFTNIICLSCLAPVICKMSAVKRKQLFHRFLAISKVDVNKHNNIFKYILIATK